MTERKRILFVDDEQFVLQGLRRLLRGLRDEWDMVFVDSAERGLAALARAPFDVVVSDMRMPGMDGAEFLTRVMQQHPETVRIVLSGHADGDLVLKAARASHQFLAKPCEPQLLQAVIEAAANRSGRFRALDVRRILGRVPCLPSMPALHRRIQDLLASDRASADSLAQVVQQDPGMTATVLKLVNSAFFGLRLRVSDPREAIAFLGVETLKSLALLQGLFEGPVPPDLPGTDPAHLWQHALETAFGAQAIAKLEGQSAQVQSDCFAAGLLHDAGLLILAAGFPDAYPDLARGVLAGDTDLVTAERLALGVDHAEAGAYLLGLWGLPEPVVEAVAHHHAPGTPAGPAFGPTLAVHAAEALADQRKAGPMLRGGDLDENALLVAGAAGRIGLWTAALAGPWTPEG